MSDAVITTIAAVLTVGVVYIGKLAVNFINSQINSLQIEKCLKEKEISNAALDQACKAVTIAAEVSVGKLEEIIAKELRAKIKNGEAKKEELYALAGEAYNEVISSVNPELLKELTGSLQNVELYIKNQIENQLLLLKAKLNGSESYGYTKPYSNNC